MSQTSKTIPIEVHFTQGFYDDHIRLLHDGAAPTKTTLTTRMQTGLAEIITLKLEGGQEVTLECTKRSLTAKIKIDAAAPFVIVALRDGTFDIAASEHRPGYL